MFYKFDKYFNISSRDNKSNNIYKKPLDIFRTNYQGKDFANGLYRVFSNDQLPKWKTIITEGYPDFENQFEPFAYDWLGRCFAIDLRKEQQNNILLFEIGTADVLEITCDLLEFHNEEIPLYNDACLASSFFEEWKMNNQKVLEHNKCAGYKIPLFLGGEDVVNNLELSDMEVYWYICSSAKNPK